MATRDPVLNAYVIHRLKQLQLEGKELKALALAAGLEVSIPSQVVTQRMGIGAKTAAGFARMLGFSRDWQLKAAAEEWAESNDIAIDPSPPRVSPHARARRIAQGIGVLERAIARVDAMYPAARHEADNERWWLEHYLAEDRMARQDAPVAAEKAPTNDEKKLRLTARKGPRELTEGSSTHKKPA